MTAIPSFLIILFSLDTYKILIFSQVVLSVQLPFTLIPLIILCGKKKIMGSFSSRPAEFILSMLVSAIVIALNAYLLVTTLFPGGN